MLSLRRVAKGCETEILNALCLPECHWKWTGWAGRGSLQLQRRAKESYRFAAEQLQGHTYSCELFVMRARCTHNVLHDTAV